MKKNILIIASLFAMLATHAQDMGNMQHMQKDTAAKKLMKHDHAAMMKNMQHDTTHKMTMMTSQFSLDLPMNRDGSGTSWVPDETPMYMYMIHGKKWMQMVHGSVFLRYNKQDLFNKGSRGGTQFDAPNWLMYMAQRKVGKNGLFAINTMFSFDPFTVGAGGYPLLYQTGESYKGNKLVDRQHPHDLFAELSIAYTQRVAKNADVSLSIGYPGEPALGPPVFMHRLSAMNNPDAPLSHHYADATHITFGTATLGFRYKNVKLEGSVFTGREPDEHRYDFDKAKFDSYSVRLSVNPSKEWALQVSNGWLKSPEEAEPLENIRRFTASAIHTKMLGDASYVATTLVFGQNHHNSSGANEPAILLEHAYQFNKNAIYGRYEYVQKDAGELDLEAQYPTDPRFNINAVTLGYNRILTTFKQTNLTVGTQATANFSPTQLKTLYGNAPLGFQVYLRITPALMKMGGKHKMDKMMDMVM
ncbi:hypothetical protein [Mucilaginibacter gilvus]|uniref:Uncharacterized protein n=1 Tax=Mucilaginibacter gilvus TaxID=2305909 RepID=A0A444MTC0_9SPHI|nr:hypothetical protein [Mucilaginibacter gilvus]RWY55872.1 hypothetical protein EPL05_05735 [Mucilaginibacter gilvus]